MYYICVLISIRRSHILFWHFKPKTNIRETLLGTCCLNLGILSPDIMDTSLKSLLRQISFLFINFTSQSDRFMCEALQVVTPNTICARIHDDGLVP